MLLSPSYKNRKTSDLHVMIDSQLQIPGLIHARHSLASPMTPSPLLSLHDFPTRSRKSSLLPPSLTGIQVTSTKESSSQATNLLSVVAIGKLKNKAEQTKQFLREQARNAPVNMSLNEPEIARIVLKVLMKPGEQRTPQERGFLMKTLKGETFFQWIKEQVEKDVFHKVFVELRHMFYARNRIICKKGDVIKKALLILEGEIAILSPRKPNENDSLNAVLELIEPNQMTPTENREKNLSLISKKNMEIGQKNAENRKFFELMKSSYPDFVIREIIKVGRGVGLEELLVDSEKISEVLVVAKENTHFLALMKENFQKLKDEYKVRLLNEKLEFLKSFPMFAKWSTNNLKVLLGSCEIKTFPYASVVFRENDPANCIYLIKNGEIEISKVVKLEKQNKNQDFPSFQAAFNQSLSIKHSSYVSLNRVWSAKESRQSHQRMIVSKLCTGQFFGENELFSKETPNRLCRAVVKSQFAELFIVPRQKFLELSSLLNSLSVVKDFADSKKNWRDALLKASQNTLMTQPSNIIEGMRESGVEAEIDEFQLISHVKKFKLLDKEFQVLNGRRPIRGEYKETQSDRPLTARETRKTGPSSPLNESHDEARYRDLNLRIMSSSPKNKEKRQKEIERRVFAGKMRKMEKNEFYTDFVVGRKNTAEGKVWREKIQKMKIYKRLKVDKMFPKKEFFG